MAQPVQRKKMFRFSIQDDIQLMTLVVSSNPFTGDATNKWATIAEEFMYNHKDDIQIDGRRCRERSNLLLSYFKSDDKEKLYRSGTTEEYDKKKQLLQEMSELANEGELQRANNAEKGAAVQQAQMIRKKAMESLKSCPPLDDTELDDSVTPKKRFRKNTSALQFIREKNQHEQELKEKQLEVEKDKIELEKERHQMEHQRFELEKQERLPMINLLTNLMNKNQNKIYIVC